MEYAGEQSLCRFCLRLVIAGAALSLATACGIPKAPPTEAEPASPFTDQLPLAFEPNRGQSHHEVKFLARGSGYTLALTAAEAVFALHTPQASEDAPQGQDRPKRLRLDRPDRPPKVTTTELRLTLVGAKAPGQVTGEEPLPGKSNYFVGNDPKKWRTNVPHYARVRYAEVYPGVDWVFYGRQRQLKSDFVVAPGADPKAIRIAVKGADKLSLDDKGNLMVHTRARSVVLAAPVIYQDIEGARKVIPGTYVLGDQNQVGFKVSAYDTAHPLIIDPLMAADPLPRTLRTGRIPYSFTYLRSRGESVAVDRAGNAYVASGGYVMKLNAALDTLIYSTHLGDTSVGSIAVDVFGNAYVVGATISDNFPVVPSGNPVGSRRAGGSDAFVAKLNPTGDRLIYSTYLGGTDWDTGEAIAIDLLGNAYVAGVSDSTDFPTTPRAYMRRNPGSYDAAFVTKLDAAGTAKIYSTYLGGSFLTSNYQIGSFLIAVGGIAVDRTGQAHVTGYSRATDFPTRNALRSTHGGYEDAFVTKLNAAGSDLVYSTYLGGSGLDFGVGIAIDSAGNVHVTGATASSDFVPITNAVQGALPTIDAFVTKLDPAGRPIFSTYLGGTTGEDVGLGIAVDGNCNTYVTGRTESSDFPRAGTAFQPNRASNYDAFVATFNTAAALINTTFLGGNGEDWGEAIAALGGRAYVTGRTESSDFPATGFERMYQGLEDGFVFVFEPASGPMAARAMVPTGVEFSASNYTVSESQRRIDITVVRNGLFLGSPAVVHYAIVGGSATPGSDYITGPGVLRFAPGDRTKTFTFRVVQDARAEPDETVGLMLIDPNCSGVLGPQSTAILTITERTVSQ